MRTHTDRDLRVLLARSHGAPVDLSNASLEMASLSHADLRGANLAGANLRGAMLWGALLDGACLDDADLTCANLTWASLRGCSVQGALLVEADMDETTLDGGLAGATTVGADMVTATFVVPKSPSQMQASSGAAGAPGGAVKRGAHTAAPHASDADVWNAHLQTASPELRARGAAGFSRKREQLQQAQVRVLSDADLQELLRWSEGTGNPLNLRGCNLSGANLRNASLREACLAFTDASGADTRGVDLAGADLRDSCGWPTQQIETWKAGRIPGRSAKEASPVRPWWKLW